MQLLFDQGTVVLKGAPQNSQFEPAYGLLWDPRVGAFRAPGRYYTILENHLREQSISDKVIPTDLPMPKAWNPIVLRPYQETALELWQQAGFQGMTILPTGAGKTMLALSAAARIQSRTLILVPTRALLEQWQREIAKFYCGTIGVQGDGNRSLEAITVATYESAYRGISQFGNKFDLIVIDECHHFGRGMRDEILEMATAPKRLGLTATLPNADDWISRLSTLIGPPVFEVSLGDLSGTYLAPFDHFTLHAELTTNERFRYNLEINQYKAIYSEFRRACPMGTYLDWIRYAARTEEGRHALQSFQRAKRILSCADHKMTLLNTLLKRHWRQKKLIFTSDTTAAYHIARQQLIMPITADIGRKEREAMLQAFREGKLHSLVSCRVLNEGLDVPDAEIAIILGGTQGAREHIQRIGRILRPSANKRAAIFEIVCRGTIEVRQAQTRSQPLVTSTTSPL
ncbi:DEAD/DEAH box helicase family protein [Bdellovibrionota bacterium FG-1]